MPSGKTYLDPAHLLKKLEVVGEMSVADFGCGGSGYFALQAASLVGEKGRVYAVDIFKPNLSAVWRNVKMRGYEDIVRCVWSDLEIVGAAKKIKDESLDRGTLVNVLHQSKKQKEILEECVRTLKKEGRLLIVEWQSSGLLFSPQKNTLIEPEKVKKLAIKTGLALMEEFEAGPHHYGLIFTKIS